ncbi:cellobiose phosphorylase [Sulfuriferula plumbiphila]|uniref:Cellobiose phosphorylase n=2 Tax=Sulfuriferula plumbiphila TaxID=171865 RepID=A0A512L969_9PROT|nr:cellobiose phosphorylase [Sulfuriferula plumbiphila]GEP31028.1 cellobiose phosphorylase [Sulfuriferula plumbiphila]
MSSPCINRASWRLLIFLIGSTLLGGLSQTANAAGMTRLQAIDIAVQSNKDLQAARYTVEQARARLLQAGLPPNPRLDIAARNDLIFRNQGEYAASIGISQQFSVVGRIAHQKEVARVDVALALAEIRQAELKLAGDVTSRFYRILALNRQIEVRERLMDVDQKLVLGTRNRFKAAEVSELDVNTAQLELQRLTQERALLLSQRITQLAQLNQLLGRPATQAIALNDALPASDSLPSLANQQRQALSSRPDLRFALLSANRAQANQALARVQRWEDWTVGVVLEQSHLVIDGGPSQGSSRALGLSLSIPLPLRNKNQGNIAEAAATEAQAYTRIEALKLSIGNEVASTYAETERLQQALSEYQRNMLALSARNVRLALQGYNQGLIPVGDVVRIQRQQGELNIAYLDTLDQYLQALARLHIATGDYAGYVPEQKTP